jgi:tRNA(adenine34) deaminase
MLTLNHKTPLLMSELMSDKSRADKSFFTGLAAQGDPAALTSDEPCKDERGKDEPCKDERWMEEALRCAQRALESGEVPVGAVVVCEGRVVGRGWNRNLTDNDPSAHAEIVALREAGRNLGNHRLGACQLFVTIEPCAMCAGAMTHARLRRLVYGADDPKAGAVHSILQVVNHAKLNHRMEVHGGVLAGRAAEMLQEFFRKRRERSPGTPQLDGDSD